MFTIVFTIESLLNYSVAADLFSFLVRSSFPWGSVMQYFLILIIFVFHRVEF